jgi:hypothetical protein
MECADANGKFPPANTINEEVLSPEGTPCSNERTAVAESHRNDRRNLLDLADIR